MVSPPCLVATGTPMVPTTDLADTASTGAVQRRVLTVRGSTASASRAAISSGATTIRRLGSPVGVSRTHSTIYLFDYFFPPGGRAIFLQQQRFIPIHHVIHPTNRHQPIPPQVPRFLPLRLRKRYPKYEQIP